LEKLRPDVPDDVLDACASSGIHADGVREAAGSAARVSSAVESDGELYVRVNKGVQAFGGFPLSDDYNAVVAVPALPREVQIEGQGGFACAQRRTKAVDPFPRDSAQSNTRLRVSPRRRSIILSAQTEGKFEHPHFYVSEVFNQENISRIALEQQGIALENKWKANYSAFDFSEHLRKPADGGSERGLFFVTARGWDSEKKKAIKTVSDSRFVLVTDTGILTKKNADGSHDVFLMSIKEGTPLPNVVVDLLGKNGIAIQSATTDSNGHCTFESVTKSTREKTPVAFVTRNGDDISFIPYNREDRQLNFSRFDIDGATMFYQKTWTRSCSLREVFTGPATTFTSASSVKQRNWNGKLGGLPIETEVVDARDHPVQTRKINLPDSGFTELTYQTANDSPTGLYIFNVYLVKEQQALHVARFDHRERERISAGSNENRDAAFAKCTARLDPAKGDARRGHPRKSLWNPGNRSQGNRTPRARTKRVLFPGISKLHLLRCVVRREERTARTDGRAG
jgi:uncharacterized protein YfaS (alpha-2-macroglobulin family)